MKAAPAATQTFAIHGQTTFVEQANAAFTAPYSGPNSLDPHAVGKETWDVTLYAGVRPWRGAEVWVAAGAVSSAATAPPDPRIKAAARPMAVCRIPRPSQTAGTMNRLDDGFLSAARFGRYSAIRKLLMLWAICLNTGERSLEFCGK